MLRKRSRIRDYQEEARLFRSRAMVAFVGIITLVGLLVTNLYNIQINQYNDYKTRSNDNRIKVVPIAPNRGLIYDRNERILAENGPVFSLEVTPEKVKDMDDTIRRLQNFLTITPEQIERFNKNGVKHDVSILFLFCRNLQKNRPQSFLFSSIILKVWQLTLL